jgi:hypothetical protein
VKEENGKYEWEISATDEHVIGSVSDDNDGIYEYWVEVGDWGRVFSHKFDRYLSMDETALPDWREFYCEYDLVDLCYRAVWDPGVPEVLGHWEVCACDEYSCNCRDSETWGCLDECETWGCIKGCFDDDGNDGSSGTWPNPKACVETDSGTVCYPQGVFGRIGGFATYWGNEDPDAWEYQVWESEGDEESYEQIDTRYPGPPYQSIFRLDLNDSTRYFYRIASLDTVMRESTPSPGIGSVVGVGQCRLTDKAYCTALDTANSVLFIAEGGGIIDVVDATDPRQPTVIATHHLSGLGLWENIYDDPCELQYDGRLWAVCGNKGLAVLEFANGYQDIDTLCTYPVSGFHATLFKCCEGGCDQGCGPGYLRTYVYYTTTRWELLVLLLQDRPPGVPYLSKCGEYSGPPSIQCRMDESYALTRQDGCYLYVDSWDTDPYGGEYDGVHVIDISDPCSPCFVDMCTMFGGPLGDTPSFEIWARDGDKLFGKWPGIDSWPVVLDVSDPAAPTIVDHWSNPLFSVVESIDSRNIACNHGRLYVIGSATVRYPEPSRYGGRARWGGAIGYIMCPDGTPLFAAAFTDTGFDAAGDTSLVAMTIDAADSRVYVTYKAAPDTDSVEDPPFYRLKVYLDHWESQYGSGLSYQGEGVADKIHLISTGPNPFRTETTLRLSLPHPAKTHISVYDVRGRRVALLADGDHSAGVYSITWDGTDQRGYSVAPGIYFLRVRTGPVYSTRKVILIR